MADAEIKPELLYIMLAFHITLRRNPPTYTVYKVLSCFTTSKKSELQTYCYYYYYYILLHICIFITGRTETDAEFTVAG